MTTAPEPMLTVERDAMSIENDGSNSASWIDDGDKYALFGLSVKIEEPVPLQKLTPRLWVMGDAKFDIPAHWREWLGTIRAEEVEDCNLFLFSKLRSQTPDVLDGENADLKQRAWHFYVGLLLASAFAPSHKPVLLTGSRRDGEIGVRSQDDFDTPIPCFFRAYPPVTFADIQLAAALAENIDAIRTASLSGGHWRLFRTLALYVEARTVQDNIDRLHQYCRCIEGLIVPRPGDTKKQFKSRTELFIGPRHHELMGDIYDVRSAAEHLHENKYLEIFDRETRLDLMKKEAMVEYIARSTLARVLGDRNLWPHFANTTALQSFWALEEKKRRELWGCAINPYDAIVDFDPRYISDGHLGAP
jgi:hypothetical protein